MTPPAPAPARDLPTSLARRVERILTPNEVLDRCRYLALAHPIERRILGRSAAGHEIEAFEWGAPEHASVLLYGFPDPGEAVGATLLVSLLEAWGAGEPALSSLPVRWHVLPCLNRDDQPDAGASLRPARRTSATREVDWCLDAPRPETRALLDYAAGVRPVLTLALHDELQSGESLPAYIAVSRPLGAGVVARLTDRLARLGIPLEPSLARADMGPGFFVMSELATGYASSTFSRLEQYGLVLVCEVGHYEGVVPAALVEAQAHALVAALEELALLPALP
jgi:hypothetical protein